MEAIDDEKIFGVDISDRDQCLVMLTRSLRWTFARKQANLYLMSFFALLILEVDVIR